jgi:O-antigen/teichoic acid export membrane protein
MELSRRFTRNIFSGWTGFFVQFAVTMALTPLVLDALGESRYGVWALLSTITGYYGLLDVGARTSIMRSIVRYAAVGDYDRMNRVASAGLVTLLGCAVVLLSVTCVCAVFGSSFLRMPGDLAADFRWCVLAIGTSVAVQFCFFAHSAAISARQRHDLTTAIQILTQIIYACGVVLILAARGGLMALSVWLAFTNLLVYLLYWRLAKRIAPELALSPRLVDRRAFREFARFGLPQFFVNVSLQTIGYSDAIIIAATMSPAAVVPFFLANRVARCFARFFMPVGVVLFPMLTHLDAVGRVEQVRQIYLRGSRLLWLLSIGLAALAAAWANEFFALWVGERQESFDGRISDLFYILLAAAMVTAPQQMAQSVFFALGRQKTLAALFMAEAASNLGLSLALVQDYGLIGIAWGTCLPALLFQGLMHPLITCRLLDMPVPMYCREVVYRPLAVALVLAALVAVRPAWAVSDWPTLVLAGMCSCVPIVVVVLLFGLDRSDLLYISRSIRGARARGSRASTTARRG